MRPSLVERNIYQMTSTCALGGAGMSMDTKSHTQDVWITFIRLNMCLSVHISKTVCTRTGPRGGVHSFNARCPQRELHSTHGQMRELV